ncbi:hypothetical protein BJV77DRAFT_986063 [Russula vinacea]|nr:hypothetical protein BJV77DRAFT_986063 [Russula vinacea]
MHASSGGGTLVVVIVGTRTVYTGCTTCTCSLVLCGCQCGMIGGCWPVLWQLGEPSLPSPKLPKVGMLSTSVTQWWIAAADTIPEARKVLRQHSQEGPSPPIVHL